MASVGIKQPDSGIVRKAIPHVREVALVVGAYFVYMFTRKLIMSDTSIAFENADRIVALERDLGVYWEPSWQEWAMNGEPGLMLFFNWLYIFTFLPIVISTAVITYVLNRRRYLYFRNVFLLSFTVALLIFMLFPLAPPRMLPGIDDTIDTFGPSFYASRELAIHYNAFAAMPSLHFAWSLIFGFMFFQSHWVPLKILGILYPVMTLLAITITGNHYILDAVGGGFVMVASLSMMLLIQSRFKSHGEGSGASTTGLF